MPKQNYTSLVLVLDRSGSMRPLANDVIGGVNQFLAEQRKLAGSCDVTIALFDHEYQLLAANMPIGLVADLTVATYVPRGNTALLDAIGRTIDDHGRYLAGLREENRPGKVIVVIQTDGYENASKNYNKARVAEMVKRQEHQYQWSFLFMGANIDAIGEAQDLGMSAQGMAYMPTPSGVAGVYRSVGNVVSSARTNPSSGTSGGNTP